MRPTYVIAKFFSWTLSPMLLPVYGIIMALWLSPYRDMAAAARWSVVGMTFLVTCVVPAVAVLVLYKIGYVTDPGLNDREDRFIPYLITLVCYVVEVLYLHNAGAPRWIWMFMVGASVAVVISAGVNFYWKISGHMAAIGGLTALVVRMQVAGFGTGDLWLFVVAAILLSGLLGSSRMVLNCHTLGQVAAGWLNGFLCVFLLS